MNRLRAIKLFLKIVYREWHGSIIMPGFAWEIAHRIYLEN